MSIELLPNDNGRFGLYGGKFVPEILTTALTELESEYKKIVQDESFHSELTDLLNNYVGRATPLYFAKNLTKLTGGAKLYLKREDLTHTGAHKINNTIGQGLLAKRMGKHKIVAETGAGQHGVATATVCALLNLQCVIFMGENDIKRQQLNVFQMETLGAKVIPVTTGSKTLKDAVNEALRYWVTNVEDTHYILGSVVGPHPFPMIVRNFQTVIGAETKEQILTKTKQLPEAIVAAVGGGSNSIGMFYPFLKDSNVKLIGIEAAGRGITTGKTAAALTVGRPGVLHGAMQYVMQTDDGQIEEAYSISAGLDYPGVGPEHSYLKDSGRVKYEAITDKEALTAFHQLAKTEGIIPALESAHALAYSMKIAKTMNKTAVIIVCLSGRGDKDVAAVKRIEEGQYGAD